MTPPSTVVWLVAAYSIVLLGVAWAFDRMARTTSQRASRWRTGKFTYHADHDAWQCPQDQWLWPTSFDPNNRVMRYRAKPSVCNSCPVKSTCTTSEHGRQITREIDPWPHSEAGQFHRGISCVIAGLAMVLILATLIGEHTVADVLVLATTAVLVVTASIPLARHLWRSPANAPVHLPHRTGEEDLKVTSDVFTTRWNSWSPKDRQESP